MKTNQILLLIVLVAAVGIGGLVLHKKQGAAWSRGAGDAGKLVPKLPVDESLARIVITEGTNSLTLTKKDDLWHVEERGGYPANYGEIRSAILKLRDLKPVQTEQVGDSQLDRLYLLPPGEGSNTATQVEFADASGKVLTTLLLGKSQMRENSQMSQFGGGSYPVGRWVMVDGAKDKVALLSDPLSDFKSTPGDWLNKEFFKVEKIKSISVSYPESTNSWSVFRTDETGSDWTLADAKEGETLDSSKTSGFGWALSSPSFNDVEVGAEVPGLAKGKATAIKLETFDGFTYQLKVGDETDGNRPLSFTVTADPPKERTAGENESAEEETRLDKEFTDNQKKLSEKLASEKALEKWVYLVPNYTVDPLLKERGELLAVRTEESATEANDAGSWSDGLVMPNLMDGSNK